MSIRAQRSLIAQTVILLLFLFLFFVVLDIASTWWLILNSPGGIVNELNPFAVILYERLGFTGLILAKMVIFTSFAVMVMYFTKRFSNVKRFIEISQILVLCQMAVSVIVVFNNFIVILTTLFIGGAWAIVNLSPWTVTVSMYLGDIAIGALFANGVLHKWGTTGRTKHLKVFVGPVMLISPVLFLAESFHIYMWLYVIYVASAAMALGLAFYLFEADDLRLTGT